MEELIMTLEKENSEYEKLLELSKSKSDAISGRNIAKLEQITDEEQNVVSNITHLDNKRIEVTKDIANVVNTDVETLTLTKLIDLMAKQPEQRKKLSIARDKLMSTVKDVRLINESNRELIDQSLEMVRFDLNMVRSMQMAPETNNYGKSAMNVGNLLGGGVSGFDAKQ